MGMLKLEILISTYGEEGLKRLSSMDLPAVEGVRYLVSCQTGKPGPGKQTGGSATESQTGRARPDIPPALEREDMLITFSATKGLSRNRNILLRQATAPYCLIADDDLSYTPEALAEVVRILDSNPAIDIATFKSANLSSEKPHSEVRTAGSGGWEENKEKFYPDYPFDLRKPVKGYYLTSFEIAFRRARVMDTGILFNENFGVGAPHYGAGEEELWVDSLLKAGLSGSFFPVMLTLHHGPTTGTREAASSRVLRAQGIVIPVLYPVTGLPRLFLKAWRVSRQTDKSLCHCLRHILGGYKDLLLHRKRILQQTTSDNS